MSAFKQKTVSRRYHTDTISNTDMLKCEILWGMGQTHCCIWFSQKNLKRQVGRWFCQPKKIVSLGFDTKSMRHITSQLATRAFIYYMLTYPKRTKTANSCGSKGKSWWKLVGNSGFTVAVAPDHTDSRRNIWKHIQAVKYYFGF